VASILCSRSTVFVAMWLQHCVLVALCLLIDCSCISTLKMDPFHYIELKTIAEPKRIGSVRANRELTQKHHK
jgi:hypothetical protein